MVINYLGFTKRKQRVKGYDMYKRENVLRVVLLVVALIGLIFISYFVGNQINASSLQTSVVVHICGNGTIEGPEVCDDGVNNGRYAYNAQDKYCNVDCDGWAPYCGDSVLQSDYGEECDDGNNVSGDGCDAVCKEENIAPPSGGGGGGYISSQKTRVVIKGRAYPGARVTLLQDGETVTTQRADDLANFSIEIADITPGLWTFSLWAEDSEGRKSITFSFTVNVMKNMTTTISGVFLPPTIELSKVNLAKGEELDIRGQTAPQSQVLIYIESTKEIVKTATSTEEGDWEQAVGTEVLEEGMHTSRAKAKSQDGLESSYSQVLTFYIGKGVGKEFRPADINRDGKVNLIDFSILLYNWNTPKFYAADLNFDNRVDLIDFSIMMYYWTG